MAKLTGKAVGDKIVEFYGPITGRNHNINGTAAAPQLNVQVFGDGEVQVEESQTPIFRGNAGTNVFTRDRVAEDGSWVALGGPIDQASGLVTLAPTVDAVFTSIRVLVSTAPTGAGEVVVQADWD